MISKFKLTSIIGFSILVLSANNCAMLTSISTSSQSLDSISTSVTTAIGSISKSIGSISRSSSPSGQVRILIFMKDVETLVGLYGNNPEMASSMEADIARIADRNGIINWESNYGTYTSIGKGLRLSGLSREEVESIAKLSCPGKEKFQEAILEGYGV